MRGFKWVWVLLAVLLLSACSEGEKIRIGFIGGLSGRYQDLGQAGREGVLLAVEMRNAQGGVNGKQVELVARDDEQDATRARRALDDLVAMKVAAVVGPMTSSMAMAVVPRLEQANTLMVGVHTTTTELTGKDDLFFRVIDDTRKYASEVARFHYYRRNVRQVAILYDLANVDYSASWVADYKRTFEELGGVVVRALSFDSHYERDYEKLAHDLLEVQPDMVAIVANAVDTAEVVGRVRALNKTVQLAGSGWANTPRFLENGGQQVEGVLLEEYVDLEDFSSVYQNFREAFVKRFGSEPSYGASMSFEAANIIMDGLARNPDPRQLKAALLKIASFKGVQGKITFDAYGDVQRSVFFAEVREGRFQRLRGTTGAPTDESTLSSAPAASISSPNLE